MSATESNSRHQNLEKKNLKEVLHIINQEDAMVHQAIEIAIPQIESFVLRLIERIKNGGRLFYIGAGTSGRLGVVDASECPPTFGVPHEMVVGIIAGGDTAIRKAVENAEDDEQQGWKDLQKHNITNKDAIVGLAASGRTPYVIGAIDKARKEGILTSCIVCNQDSELAKASEFPIEVIVGPEVVTGSTRMKAGSAQKMVLNMISTSLMIQLGKIKGNKMVDMQLSNKKLVDRGVKMILEETELNYALAEELLLKHGSVRKVIDKLKK